MLKMKYIILYILIYFNFVFSNNIKMIDTLKQNVEKTKINYPSIELSGGIEFLWFFQLNLTISPYKHIYFQPRISSSILANETGFVFGYQRQMKDDSIIRLGFGYSRVMVFNINPGGGSNDYWKALYARIGILKKINSGSTLNPNINIIRGNHRTIFSLNIAFVFILL
jgi:hypothetical protein